MPTYQTPFALALLRKTATIALSFLSARLEVMDLDLRRVSGTSSSTFYCWAEDPREASMHDDVFSMTVNREMVNYFSQPEGRIDLGSFVAIYCANPLKDDDCPVGVCPNPDIAGPLVRIARKFLLILPVNDHLTRLLH